MDDLERLARYATLEDDWEIPAPDVFISPLVKERPAQTIIFGDRIRNGSIEADVTILDSEQRPHTGQPAREATFLVRHNGRDGNYYAGTGGFETKFFIGKQMPGPFWQARQWTGQHTSVFINKRYRLRLEFNGNQISLFENDVQQLTLLDEAYQIGQCGLSTYLTKARFENVRITKARARAFVIMPFATELDFVHAVIEQAVKGFEIDCIRADQISISRPVVEDVKTQIAGADLVIVDFTGKNPNVYYEAGLADAWKKDWIVLAQSAEDMTFDVRHIRCIRYSNTMGADRKLAADLGLALEALGYKAPTPNLRPGSAPVPPPARKGRPKIQPRDLPPGGAKSPASRKRRGKRVT